jgi:hypothetical protein
LQPHARHIYHNAAGGTPRLRGRTDPGAATTTLLTHGAYRGRSTQHSLRTSMQPRAYHEIDSSADTLRFQHELDLGRRRPLPVVLCRPLAFPLVPDLNGVAECKYSAVAWPSDTVPCCSLFPTSAGAVPYESCMPVLFHGPPD